MMKAILFFNTNTEENLNFIKNKNYHIINKIDYDTNTVLNTYVNIKDKNNKVYFCSDNIEFLILVYRLYNELFEAFLYQSTKLNTSFTPVVEHKIFLEKDIIPEENISIPIYCMKDIPEKLSINIKFDKINEIESIQDRENEPSIEKVFYFNNRFLITSGLSLNHKIIKLDNSSLPKEINIETTFVNIDSQLIPHINYILQILYVIKDFTEKSTNSLTKSKLNIEKLSKKEQLTIFIILKIIIKIDNDPTLNIFINSFLISFDTINNDFFASSLDEVISSSHITPLNKYYLLWQHLRLYFITTNIQNSLSKFKLASLYKNIYTKYKSSLIKLPFIKKEERNQDLIFIFISQFLSDTHAPTKLLLERAYYLIKNFNKDVLIINTKELLPKEGEVPFFNSAKGHSSDKYINKNSVLYKDLEIPFYQPSKNMPDEDEIKNVISIVNEYKPYLLLNIGSANLTCDLCSNIISSITLPTTSDLAITESQIRIHRSELNENNLQLIKQLQIENKSIIPFHQSYEIIPTKVNYKKEDFNLPKDKFLLGVIGNRLDNEITEEFITMLNKTYEYNIHVLFIGNFLTYEDKCLKYPTFRENTTLIGFQKNLFDVMRLFDLLVNPGRIGGGSGANCLMHSIPLVTLNYGDIHIGTKGFFSVKSYLEMKEEIIKNTLDKDYYNKQSELAKKVFFEASSTEKEVEDLLAKININPYFK